MHKILSVDNLFWDIVTNEFISNSFEFLKKTFLLSS